MKLLEHKNDAQGINIENDAIIYHLAVGKQNGILYGCNISFTGSKFQISKGMLQAQGFRLEVDTTEDLVDINQISTSTNLSYIVYLVITLTVDRDASYSIQVLRDTAQVTNSEIQERNPGSYYLPLFNFKCGSTSGSIASWSLLLKTISTSETLQYSTVSL